MQHNVPERRPEQTKSATTEVTDCAAEWADLKVTSLEELVELTKPSQNGHGDTLPVGAFPDSLLDADTDGGESR